MSCLGEVLLALGGAVNDAANGVLAHIVDLSLDSGGLLLLGDACGNVRDEGSGGEQTGILIS
jgi:hypothetical protein